MSHDPESRPFTAEQLEQTFAKWEVGNGGKTDGDFLNTFLGTDELRGMGRHLISHMRDEDRWGETEKHFEPIDFVTAAFEVAHDQTAGGADKTKGYYGDPQPTKMTFDIFINFWLPRVARQAYGQAYGDDVRHIVENSI